MPTATDKLRELVKNQFSTGEYFDIFCFEYYPSVYNRFSSETTYGNKVNLLLRYCEQKGTLDQLENRLVYQDTSIGQLVETNEDLPNLDNTKQLRADFGDRLLAILQQVPTLQDQNNRTMLLNNLPPGPVGMLSRSSAPLADLYSIIDAAKRWGRLTASNKWALVVIAENAIQFFLQGVEAEEDVKALLRDCYE